MKLTIVFSMLVFASLAAAAEIPPAKVQIAGAVLAAPAELREGAAVLGYDAQGKFGPLREGKNEMVCLATDPTKTAFNVACYHKDLEPFMARGRELLEQKVTGAKRNEIRFKEVEDGKVPMSKEPQDALRADRNSLRRGYRESAGCVLALGDLRALRHAAIHRALHQGERRRAVADVGGNGGRAYHDQSAQD